MKKRIIILLFITINSILFGQENIEQFKIELDSLSKNQVGLNEKVQVNVSGITLADFISAIALEHNLNVSVDENLNTLVVNNFYDAAVKDIYVFLVKKYNIKVNVTGSIISFSVQEKKTLPKVKYKPKEIKLSYKKENDFLSLNLRNDSLLNVAAAITKKSGKNVILSKEAKRKLVTVYIENRPFDQVLEMLVKSNDLAIEKTENGFYYIDVIAKEVVTKNNSNSRSRGSSQNKNNNQSKDNLQIIKNDDGTISVIAYNESIEFIIKKASIILGEHYFMYDVPIGNTNIDVEGITFEELLHHTMRGTEYTFKKKEKYFVIGNRNTEGLRASRLIQLENRTIETVLDLIPKELLTDIEVKEFIELNGLIVSGSYIRIEELEAFIRSVDQVVPMIQIDIIIVTTSKTSLISSGISAGISDAPVSTSGSIFPGVNMDIGAGSINSIINALNGFGVVNFGLVSSNFYISLDALETNKMIDITSTPKLSALNGHEASITVGETRYYSQKTSQYTPTINGVNTIENVTWIPVNANLTVKIKPFVSTDGYVTLEISVQQDDFIVGSSSTGEPPGSSTQTFESLVRVKNGEMILMGGLEKDAKIESGTGTPLLSRIPIIKWFFSSKSKEKEKSKLHIFLKPTVTY